MYSYGPPHMAGQKQNDQLEHTCSSHVRIRDVALKTCQRWWTIGRSGERGSGVSLPAAWHDDDDDDTHIISLFLFICLSHSFMSISRTYSLSLSLSLSPSDCLSFSLSISHSFYLFLSLSLYLSFSISLSLSLSLLSLSLWFISFRPLSYICFSFFLYEI